MSPEMQIEDVHAAADRQDGDISRRRVVQQGMLASIADRLGVAAWATGNGVVAARQHDQLGRPLVEKWRKVGRTMPVLLLTARDRWSDKVAGIDAGADDYVAKPFHMEEVLARVRALVRRAAGRASNEITVGRVGLDTRAGRVEVDGRAVKLTSHEYRLLAYLMMHQGRVVSRTELTEHLYDQDFDRDSNTIEVFVGRLRKKLEIGRAHV